MSCISASSSGLFEDAQRRRAEECTPPIIRREYHWSFHHHTKKRRPGLLSRFSSKIGFRKDIRIIISRGKVVVDVNQRRRRVSHVPFLHFETLNNLEGPFRWGKIYAYKSSSRFDALSVSTNNNKIIMYVEEVCIDGFKSYAQRTIVPQFDQYFNAITGLNGSGKSNILDSICFVLGITNLSQVTRRCHSFCRRLFASLYAR